MRARKKPNLGPRLAACETLMIKNPTPDAVKSAFPSPLPLHLEIGCGKGGFICETALRTPEANFLAVEREPNVIVSALEKARGLALPNLRFILGDADILLEELFAPDSLERVYINFCDPWHKNRHAKRRLTYRDRLTLYRRLLAPGGELWFKSDNLKLYHFSLEEFEAAFPAYFTTCDLHASIYAQENIMTEYEQRFSELGQPIYAIRARKDRGHAQTAK